MAAAIPAAPRKAALYYLALILAGLRPDHGGPLSGRPAAWTELQARWPP